MIRHPMITLSREYGSGGHDIGEQLAKRLDLPFYDNELISIAAKDSGYGESLFHEAERTASNPVSFAFKIATAGRRPFNMPLNNQLFSIQSSLIRTIADQGSALFVGRCADWVLKDYAPCINIFIQADLACRIRRVMERMRVGRTEAEELARRTDKCRATYYNFYTDQRWGARGNYHIVINSSVGPDFCVDLLEGFCRKRLEALKQEP
ncbi:MAG: AAA family ATPase [Candidatus Excrementavichristensenella sp.]